jgi:hypothetical protein
VSAAEIARPGPPPVDFTASTRTKEKERKTNPRNLRKQTGT